MRPKLPSSAPPCAADKPVEALDAQCGRAPPVRSASQSQQQTHGPRLLIRTAGLLWGNLPSVQSCDSVTQKPAAVPITGNICPSPSHQTARPHRGPCRVQVEFQGFPLCLHVLGVSTHALHWNAALTHCVSRAFKGQCACKAEPLEC